MSESDPVSKENSDLNRVMDKCEDSNISQASSDTPGTMPTFHSIEIVETQENNSQEFVNESTSANEGSGGSEVETQSEAAEEASESENSQDVIELDSGENSYSAKEVSNKLCSNNQNDIQNQDAEEPAAKSWPTLEILPGGIIRPTDNDYPYFIHVDQQVQSETEDLMYACAKCPMRFKVLNSLTLHVREHEEEKKKKGGPDEYKKLTNFERKFLVLKRKRVCMETEHKNKKIDVMKRIANAFAKMDPELFD